jgi:TIR domain
VSTPIFISYSSSDQKVAETICDALQSRGCGCWIACRDIGPGENFQESIVKAIRSAKLMLLVFTSNANNSNEIKKELVLAGRYHVTVIPVRVEDVAPNDALAYEFATRQWIDLFKDWEREIERLVSQIGSILTEGAPKAGAPIGDGRAAPAEKSVAQVAVVKKFPFRPAMLLLPVVVLLALGGAYLYTRPAVQPASPALPSAPQSNPDESEWLKAANLGTMQAFSQYLKDFPAGAYVAEARQRVQAGDEKAWADAVGTGTIVALNQYLGQFPDGAHAAQAQRSIAAFERQAGDPKPSQGTRRFDGTWQTTISCTAAADSLGYTLQFTSQVKDGIFHGERGTEGKPDSLTLEGKIQLDGSADLYARGLTNQGAYAIGNPPAGSVFSYHILARFEGSSGTGSRVELRPCTFTAFKR